MSVLILVSLRPALLVLASLRPFALLTESESITERVLFDYLSLIYYTCDLQPMMSVLILVSLRPALLVLAPSVLRPFPLVTES